MVLYVNAIVENCEHEFYSSFESVNMKITFSNFSCIFLNPNNFFQFEL
jgi:hypothetical protein